MSVQMKPIAPLDALWLVLIAAIWAVNNVAAKYALLHLSPLFASSIRFILTALLLIPFWRPPPGMTRPLSIVGLMTAAHFGIQAVGLWMAHDLAPMVIAMQLWIPASTIFASIFLHERMGARRVVGVVVSFLGIIVLAADRSIIPQLGAFALVGLASVIYGGVSIVVRRGPAVHPLAYQAWIALAATATLLPLSLATERDHTAQLASAGWLAFACLAYGALASSVVANALMFSLVRKYEVARTTPYMFLSPILAIALGAWLLGDTITPQFLIGGAITIAGVALTALAERGLRAAPAE